MRVHIVGSKPKDMTEPAFEKMKTACREIGMALAERGHDISAGSIRTNTADRYVLEGYFSKTIDRIVNIHLLKDNIGMDEIESNIEEFKVKFPGCQIVQELSDGTTYSRHIDALSGASAILVIGGNEGAATAGFAAPAMKIPILAIPQFGGAGAEVFDFLKVPLGRSLLTNTDIDKLDFQKWSASSAQFIVTCIETLVRMNPFDERITVQSKMFFIAVPLAIIAWIFAFSLHGTIHPTVLFFCLMFTASIIGTFLRTLLRVYFDYREEFSALRVVNDLTLGMVVAFSFFLLYSVGGVIYDGSATEILTDDRVIRSSTFMSLVALAASALLETSVGSIKAKMEDYLKSDKKP